MKLVIYGLSLSPPARAVKLTADLLQLPYEFKDVDVLKGEQLQPEFLEINPLHTIPVIDDNGFILFESHAIILYLIAKYAKDDSIYPQDTEKRATLNQRLFFNSSILFPRLREAAFALVGTGSISGDVLTKATEAVEQLESLLGDNDWIVGTPNFTVADICVLSTLENYTATMPGLINSRQKIVAYLKRGRDAIPGYEELMRPAVKELAKLLGTGTEE